MIFSHSTLLNNFSNTTHAFSTKLNGNLAFHVNDNVEKVIENHENLAKELKYNKDTLVHMKQIHSDIVHIVTKDDNFNNPPTCDALITDKKDTPLMVMVADCSPILFYDSSKNVIAVAHAGRQGAFKNIVKNVIDTFVNQYASNTDEIYVSIGASILSCCYEVGSEINDEAKSLGFEYAMSKRENSFYLDVSKILKAQLLDSNIEEKNIAISKECTKCSSDKYFSYRDQPKTGRFSGVIMLNL